MSQTESGVAEQMVGMSIRALESLARLLGSGAKNLAVFLFTVARNTKPYRGITSVKSLLDGGHELKTLELDKKELHEFCVHAKKNDFPCTVIHDKRLYQDKVPVLIRTVDAARANRVVELMRLERPAQERQQEEIREAPNPTTERTASPSPSRSRPRPSAPRFSGRENTDSISPNETRPSELRPSVRKKILSIQRERRAERAQAAQERAAPEPIMPPVRVWNERDERMMEAVRQFIATLTAITQEVTQSPQTVSPPAHSSPIVPSQPQQNREPTPRQSVRTSVAQARQRRDASAAARTPASAPKRGAPTKGGR